MNLSPIQQYQSDSKKENFTADSAQQRAVEFLQRLYEELIDYRKNLSEQGVFARWAINLRLKKSNEIPQGVYFWGGVGRGKTYLMDIFYESLPFKNKMRTHFHRFMRRVHRELDALKGQRDPLLIVADKLAADACVICFDEFFVSDITDAMILANLLQALFDRGVTLVATSNIAPEGLYKDGLQRARFIPAIKLLQERTHVVNVDGGVDYRLRALEKAPLYHLTDTTQGNNALMDCFKNLVPQFQCAEQHVALDIEGREIFAKWIADDVAWFEFAAICEGPRSQNDYIELAREYHAVIVENVPIFTPADNDKARRFIYLVDEFYDRRVKLILAAEKPVEALYQGGALAFEFERTKSRIIEMQSTEYLAEAHRP